MSNRIDIKAAQKLAKIPSQIQKHIIDNVFCGNCTVSTIVDYSIENDKYGVLLKGKCKKCGRDIARLVEDS